jgi:hypothetical protein
MYTWEIRDIMEQYHYNLPSYLYFSICLNSSQIERVTNYTDEDKMYIKTKDGGEFYFTIYYQNKA